MIRTLVVDDDFQIASVHRAFTERIPGFSVVGTAHTGADALAQVRGARPDLVLLDVYLPDLSGLEVLAAIRAIGPEPPDVIVITAARDVDTLRGAMQGGVVHYLIKPFAFDAFKSKLESYASLRTGLAKISEADQGDVDRLFGVLRPAAANAVLPKGLSAPTLELVERILEEGEVELTASEVAQRAGLSRVTARRYLEHLCSLGRVDLAMRYGLPGRPEHRYRATKVTPPA
ncbi:MAG: response regulator [Chloroflexi bacterium]|nr:response regulator [Chloroflexota bacterium]